MLKPGDKAPLNTSVLNEDGKTTSLNDLLSKYTVLYFYPKDNTPGCTTEACDFRDANVELQKLDVQVVGISKDSLESHQKFSAKHQLNFPLWSDPNHELLESFGAWGKKNSFGKIYMGIIRSTFIINPKGEIIKSWEKVKVKTHTQEVLDFLKKEIK